MASKVRAVLSRMSGASDQDNQAAGVSSAVEPCAGCGEETAVGSVFFSDRHTIRHDDGRQTFLCTLCDARIRSSRRGRRLTDAEVRTIVENDTLAAFAWTSGGQGS